MRLIIEQAEDTDVGTVIVQVVDRLPEGWQVQLTWPNAQPAPGPGPLGGPRHRDISYPYGRKGAADARARRYAFERAADGARVILKVEGPRSTADIDA